MKGVILAGGAGTRLFPNTKVTNKHLLPVYDRPMIYYAIENMIKAGIEDILILPGKDHAGDFAKLLGSGKDFNVRFTFKIQDHAGGLAYAVGLAEDFVGDDNFLVIFADNIIDNNFYEDVQNFKSGAQIFCKEVNDPQRFGIAEVEGDKVINIVEKPAEPKSNWAVIGAYIYDSRAFEYIKTLKPSDRGELEITDLNNVYLKNGTMKASFMKGEWYDTGTHESLATAAYNLMMKDRPVEEFKLERKNSPKVGVGFVLHKSEKYLKDFCQSLKTQDYKNLEIYAVDNNEEEENEDVKYLKNNFPEVKIIRPGSNVGFSAGHNLAIRKAANKSCEFYATLNFDMVLEENFISELLNSIMKSPRIASSTGKIKRWNFDDQSEYKDGKTNFIDSAGLVITKEHRFSDRGQGEIDHGQYNEEEEIFGASAAAAIYRIAALDDVAFVNEKKEKEYFDELMFMYKEDIDLAYRLQLAGYKSIYTPTAIAYHKRSLFSKGDGIISIVGGRWNRGKEQKEWSWSGHHIILQKILRNDFSANVYFKTLWYEFKSFVYILFFEPFLLKQYLQMFKLRSQIRDRREQIKKRVDAKSHIEKWMD
ncbi:MAG: sugar phosphate nucleotidyltransferase [bacterium]